MCAGGEAPPAVSGATVSVFSLPDGTAVIGFAVPGSKVVGASSSAGDVASVAVLPACAYRLETEACMGDGGGRKSTSVQYAADEDAEMPEPATGANLMLSATTELPTGPQFDNNANTTLAVTQTPQTARPCAAARNSSSRSLSAMGPISRPTICPAAAKPIAWAARK